MKVEPGFAVYRALFVALCVLIPASTAWSEVCTFSTDGDWGPFSTFTGTDDCTLDASDSVVIPSGVTVTMIADTLGTGDAAAQVTVEGVLEIDTTRNSNSPINFTFDSGVEEIVGDDEIYLDINGGQVIGTPSYAQAGRNNASPGFVTSRTSADAEWSAAEVYECATAASLGTTVVQNCGTAGHNILLRWAEGSVQASANPLSPRTMFVDEAMNNIATGQQVCMLNGLAKNLCGEIIGVNDGASVLGPHDILVDFSASPQGLDDTDGYSLAYRETAELTTGAAYAAGETCFTVTGTTITTTLSYAGRPAVLPNHPRPLRIERTEAGTDCAGAATAGDDAIHLLNPTGLLADLANGATVRLSFGISAGDTFEVFASPTFVDGTVATNDGRILVRGATGSLSGEALSFDGLSAVIWDDPGGDVTATGWTVYDGGNGSGNIFNLRAVGDHTFNWVRWFSAQPNQDAHPLVINAEASGATATITDSSCWFARDDCFGTQGTAISVLRMERAWSMFMGLDAEGVSDLSGQLFDGTAASPLSGYIRDSGAVNGNRVGGAANAPGMAIINPTPAVSVDRIAVVACDDCQIYRGSLAGDASPTNVFAAGIKQVAGGAPIMDRATYKNALLRNVEAATSSALDTLSEDGATNSVFDNVSTGSGAQWVMNETMTLENNLFLDSEVGAEAPIMNFQECGSISDCTVTIRNNTWANRPAVTTLYEQWLSWPNADTNHTVGTHIFENNCFVRVITRGTGITLNYVDPSDTEFTYFADFSPNLFFGSDEEVSGTFSNGVREWTVGLNGEIAAEPDPSWRGIAPGLGQDYFPVRGSFAKSQGLCAGVTTRPGLKADGEYLSLNGITPSDLGFSAGGGGGKRPHFAPIPFGSQ